MAELRFLTFTGGFVTLVAIMLTLIVDTKHEKTVAVLGWTAWAGAFVCLGTALARWYLLHP